MWIVSEKGHKKLDLQSFHCLLASVLLLKVPCYFYSLSFIHNLYFFFWKVMGPSFYPCNSEISWWSALFWGLFISSGLDFNSSISTKIKLPGSIQDGGRPVSWLCWMGERNICSLNKLSTNLIVFPYQHLCSSWCLQLLNHPDIIWY